MDNHRVLRIWRLFKLIHKYDPELADKLRTHLNVALSSHRMPDEYLDGVAYRLEQHVVLYALADLSEVEES